MKCRPRTLPYACLLAAMLLFPSLPNRAAEDTFTAVNPATGQTEAVWIGTPAGTSLREVYWSVLQDEGWAPAVRVTTDAADDHRPTLAFSPAGARHLVFWKSQTIDTVYYTTSPATGGAWTTPVAISDPAETSRDPRVVVHGGTVSAAWSTCPTTGSPKIVVGKGDSADPWARTTIAILNPGASPAVQIASAAGHLWVDWIDSASSLGYSESLSGTWGAVNNEPYLGVADIDAGRLRIKGRVVN